MQRDRAADSLRLALKQIEESGAVSGTVLSGLKALVRDLEGRDTQLDYVQRQVTIHALECLMGDCMDGPRSHRAQAQYVVEQCPVRRKNDEAGHQSVEIIIREALDLLK